jgi:tetratricopeptide (TPR) repeat protein
LHKRGKTDESAKIFVSLLGAPVADKFTPVLLEWLAGYWSTKKDYKKAKHCAEVMLSKFTEKSSQQIAWAILGRCYLAEKNQPKAEEALEKALNIDVETEYAPEAALRLGEIKLASGKNDQAMKYFDKAAGYKVGADDSGVRAHAYAGLAKASQVKGDMDAASKYYMSVAILYDEETLVSECLYEAVKVFLKQGKSDDADKAVTELSRRYPKSPYIGQLKGQK